jgi:NAD(P)-dependent dehydrogenase (short-subunit alcohol dehydrogenase family)
VDGASAYLVVGATGGIGAATARALAGRGASLALGARDGERLDVLADELGALALPVDATDFDAVGATVGRAKDAFGRLDGIVNCAGSVFLKPAHATSADDWAATIGANLTTAFAVVRAGARALDDGGVIVLVSSAAARVGFANHEAIAAAKAGVVGLTLSAAATYASRGIRVNAVAPGMTRTPATERIVNGPGGEASCSMHPLGRLGEPKDVASAITWLLDPAQSWVTGQVLGVDGGITAARAR